MVDITELEELIWAMLLQLAAGQYNKGTLGDPSGDNFSEMITPYHTKILTVIDSVANEAVVGQLEKLYAERGLIINNTGTSIFVVRANKIKEILAQLKQSKGEA